MIARNHLDIIIRFKKEKKDYGYKVSKYFVVPSIELMTSNFFN